MKRSHTTSGSGLFLIELILSLLIFSLVSVICIRIFALSWQNRKMARAWNHVQEITENVTELLKAGDGSPESFSLLFPEAEYYEAGLKIWYDLHWQPSTPEEGKWQMILAVLPGDGTKEVRLLFLTDRQEILAVQTIRLPATQMK